MSDPVEVPAGAPDAWAVTSESETDAPVGDIECADHVLGIEVDITRSG